VKRKHIGVASVVWT